LCEAWGSDRLAVGHARGARDLFKALGQRQAVGRLRIQVELAQALRRGSASAENWPYVIAPQLRVSLTSRAESPAMKSVLNLVERSGRRMPTF
jgi:hypothetical protein